MKSEQYLVGQRYAKALIDLVFGNKLTPNLPESVAGDLTLINRTITESPDLKRLLNHPSYSISQKKVLLQNIFMAQVQEFTLHLLDLLVNRRRLDLLPAIASQYNTLLNEKKNLLTAQLTAAEELSENNLADLKARLSENMGKSLHLEVAVDPSIIAGYILRIKDQVIDGSLKGRLSTIEKTLLSV